MGWLRRIALNLYVNGSLYKTYFSDGNTEIFDKKRRNIIIEKLSDNEEEDEFD